MTDTLLIIVASFLGALGAGSLGWFESNEPFSFRKFFPTIWRALFAALIFAVTYQGNTTTTELIAAFLAGAGVDVIGKRIQAGVNNRSLPTIDSIKKDINLLSGRESK